MKSTIHVEEPDQQAFVLSTTMTLKEWKLVKKALVNSGDYTPRCFADHIRKLVDLAEEQFHEYSGPGSSPHEVEDAET